MKEINVIQVQENDMFICLSSEVRYALGRDNHLAPATSADLVRRYLPLFSDERKKDLTRLLINDIEFDLRLFERKYKHIWLDLLEFLKGEQR